MSNLNQHMENDLVLRYAIYLEDPDNLDYDGRQFSKAELSGMKQHIADCPSCSLRLDEIRNDFFDLTQYLDSNGFSGISTHPVKRAKQLARPIPHINWPTLVTSWRFRVAIVVAISLIFLTSTFYVKTSYLPYLSLATITKEDLSANLRSGASTELHNAILSFQNEEYGLAIDHFEIFLKDKKQADLHTFAHYYAGLSYLLDSRETFLGKIVGFNQNRVDDGMRHLQSALSLTSNIHYIEDAQWYLAKAYLIKANKAKAISALTTILEYKGRRRAEAIALLGQLNET